MMRNIGGKWKENLKKKKKPTTFLFIIIKQKNVVRKIISI